MDIESIRTIALKQDDVLLIEMDFGQLPPSKVKECIEKVKADMFAVWPDNKTLIYPKGQVSFAILTHEY